MKPLDGVKVIDMTHVLAGPYCGYQLGLLGADVIKVESPYGDMIRLWGDDPAQLEQGITNNFAAQNAGKRSLCVDIKKPAGAEIVRKLADQADVFIENFRPGTMKKFDLDYDTVMSRNGRIIYVSISAFGQDGPHGHRPGFDDVIQATSGFMSINVRGDGPIRTGGPVLDYSTGMQAAAATMAALLLRDKTGESQRVDIAMQDVAMLLMNRNTSAAATTGSALPPPGNREGTMLGRFKTKDGYVMLAGYLPHHCKSICKAIGLDDLAALDTATFYQRAEEVERRVEERLLEKSSEEWDGIFSRAGVVAGGVRDLVEVFETGQPNARGLVSDVGSAAGPFKVTTAGYRINNQVFAADRDLGVPKLGEQTGAILADLGYEDGDIREFLEAGVVK